MKNMKISGKEIFDIVLAGLIVNDVPQLLGGFTGKQFSGTTEDLVGGGIGVLTGVITKKPLLTNASLAIAIFNIFNGMIQGTLQTVVGKATSQAPALKPASVPIKVGPGVSDYVSLPMNDYVSGNNAGIVSSYGTYKNSYRSN